MSMAEILPEKFRKWFDFPSHRVRQQIISAHEQIVAIETNSDKENFSRNLELYIWGVLVVAVKKIPLVKMINHTHNWPAFSYQFTNT